MRKGAGLGVAGAIVNERPSVFQSSSSFGTEDRESTIQKIDAIEAHMVKAWAKSKVAAAGHGKPDTPPPPVLRTEVPAAKPAPKPLAPPPQPAPQAPAQDADEDFDLDFTAMLAQPAHSPSYEATQPMALEPAPAEPAPVEELYPSLEFEVIAIPKPLKPSMEPAPPPIQAAAPTPAPAPASAPTPAPVEVDLGPIEGELHDAAMRFSEGDSAGAEAVLLGLMQKPDLSVGGADVVASALFDLYRCTGQQDGFDVVAMDYAQRFGRSPAEWFSVLDQLGHGAGAAALAPAPSHQGVHEKDSVWVAPTVLGAPALATLKAAFSSSSVAWHMDWTPLTEITPDAAPTLAELLEYWCNTPVELHWSGAEALLQALEQHTPADDNTTDTLWWRLRMDTLCVVQEHDAFESLALDYCVVYEVSPPSWKVARCKYVHEAEPSAFMGLDGPISVMPDDALDQPPEFVRCALVGEVTGDAGDALARLHNASERAPRVLVSCALLLRTDFSAAGSILNWATACEAAGCQVEFEQVPRLVALFFEMLGIHQHARITVRTN